MRVATSVAILGLLGLCVIAAPASSLSIDIGYYVLFDYGRVMPNTAGQQVIKQVVEDAKQKLSKTRYVNFSIVGHADRSGPEAYNLVLSRRRAETVRDILVSAGIPSENFNVIWRGETEPAVPTADGEREKANRRVEIIIQ